MGHFLVKSGSKGDKMKYNVKQLEKRIEFLEECNKEHCNINDKMVDFIEKIVNDFSVIIKFIETLPDIKQKLLKGGCSNGKKKT